MKRANLGMMTLLALVLGACGNGQTKDSGAEKSQVTQGTTTAEVTTQTTTTVAPKPDNKELYAKSLKISAPSKNWALMWLENSMYR